MTPVQFAALNGYTDCVKKLISAIDGFDFDMVDDKCRTCMHAAACGGYGKSEIHCNMVILIFYKGQFGKNLEQFLATHMYTAKRHENEKGDFYGCASENER